MTQVNADGLFLKFGLEEAASSKGGTYSTLGPLEVTEYKVDYTDIQSATTTAATRLGAVTGTVGIQLPRGAIVEKIEFVVETAFTSSGTLASGTLVLGMIADDYTVVTSTNGLTTASLTAAGLVLQTVGTETVIKVGSTGAGTFLGTALAASGYPAISNSTHASNPYTAGKLAIRFFWYMPQTNG